MVKIFLYFLFSLTTFSTLAQTGQLSIPRVDQMPDLPAPLVIRNWDKVALDYDAFVFDFTGTGQYLPLSRPGTQGQFNYPDNTPLFLDSYVGVDGHLNQAEAINIIPAIVGASLAGIDKSNQNGMNWVAMTKDFFNLKNGQHVYLNSYSTNSGDDWWYDVMPNVYFYQLKSLYPDAAPEFSTQFTTVADRWLGCVYHLGGSTTPWSVPNMNYRAFNLITGLPLNTSVPEPESAGSIAWLLYNAYLETGNRNYFAGAQQAMDFLSGFISNPSYELQLSYGTLIAARMNAVEGTNYPLQKLLDWCFNRGELREWGAIVGTWGGYDVSGLIGEANDAGDDYAFIMNGFQQAAALAPLPKYDKRYARAIAKWILNITNASRLFYRNALPQNQQDSYAWALANDTAACIPHESMKEILNGKSPFATGDAIGGGWAETNLSLYSGSSVGYLAAVADTTNIAGILQIDLNKTDFYAQHPFPTYLYYNPTGSAQLVALNLPAGSFDIYDAITEHVILTNVTGIANMPVPSDQTRMISLISAGAVTESRNGKLYIGQSVLDYHYAYDFSTGIRIKALAVDRNPVVFEQLVNAYCEVGNLLVNDVPQYEWYLDDSLLTGADQRHIEFIAPSTTGTKLLKCKVTLGAQQIEDTLSVNVVDHIPQPPVVHGIQTENKYEVINTDVPFTVPASPVPGEILSYAWSTDGGSFSSTDENTTTWTAPANPGVYTVSVDVSNQDGLSTLAELPVLVKDTTLLPHDPLIYYPFDVDTRNVASDRFHATASGVTKTSDARGMPSLAYRFTSGQDIIYTDNNADLNFTDAVSLSCWVKCEQLGSERFIISHGSWQQRYKLSLTPEGLLRWTVKTSAGVSDLDGSAPLELNRYYHVCAIYTGYSLELYVDGVLDTFKAFSGTIQPSTKPLTIGRMDNIETQYALLGSVDEVKLWDKEIPVSQVSQLKNQWATPTGIIDLNLIARIYPNPAKEVIYVEFNAAKQVEHISLFTADGSEASNFQVDVQSSGIMITVSQTSPGLYLLRILMKDGSMITRKIIIR
jgi:hypothetical protein